MNQRASMERLFQSPLFSTTQASPEQLKKYALVFWPIQVNFIVGLPALTGTICEQIGKLALAGTNSAEEKRLKAILRHMFPPTIDELGHGPGQPRCVHHDLFAAQVQACTGLEQQTLRKDWIRGSANQRLANAMRESVRSVQRRFAHDVCRGIAGTAIFHPSGGAVSQLLRTAQGLSFDHAQDSRTRACGRRAEIHGPCRCGSGSDRHALCALARRCRPDARRDVWSSFAGFSCMQRGDARPRRRTVARVNDARVRVTSVSGLKRNGLEMRDAGVFQCVSCAQARSSRHGAAISCTPKGRPSVLAGHSGAVTTGQPANETGWVSRPSAARHG